MLKILLTGKNDSNTVPRLMKTNLINPVLAQAAAIAAARRAARASHAYSGVDGF